MDTSTEDEIIDCTDCLQPFTFTGGEAEYYRQKGLIKPKRCKACRELKKIAWANRTVQKSQEMRPNIGADHDSLM